MRRTSGGDYQSGRTTGSSVARERTFQEPHSTPGYNRDSVPGSACLCGDRTNWLKVFARQTIREWRFPLRISIRGQMDHSLHLVVKEVLSAAGFSLDDVV